MSASVFPARAGMSLHDDGDVLGDERVPRASGDEPRAGRRLGLLQMCSPRERG